MFDRLKRIFIIEDKKAKVKKPSSPSAEKTVPSGKKETVDIDQTVPSQTSSSQGTPSSKFTEILFQAIESNGMEGFDYLEYKESLQSLAKMDMDEATRYKSAFAMAQTMGATPKKLIESAKHYKKVLQQEETKFGEALENQRSRQISEQENKISSLENSISTKKEQLTQIEQQIAQAEASLAAAKQNLKGTAAKINGTKANFMASYQQISEQLNTDIEKMQSYLK